MNWIFKQFDKVRCTFQSSISLILILLILEMPDAHAELICAFLVGGDKVGGNGFAIDPDTIFSPPGPCCGLCGCSSTLPATGGGAGGAGGGGCTSNVCGNAQGSSMALNSDPQQMPISADQLNRSWIATERSSNSSFSPGFFSQFDSQVQVFPATGSTTITYLNVFQKQVTTFVDGLNGDTLDGIFVDQKNGSARQIELQNAAGVVVSNPAQATKVVVKHWTGGKETFGLIDLDPSPTAVILAGRLTSRSNRLAQELASSLRRAR